MHTLRLIGPFKFLIDMLVVSEKEEKEEEWFVHVLVSTCGSGVFLGGAVMMFYAAP